MSDTSVAEGASTKTDDWISVTRFVLNFPVFTHEDEGVVMEIIESLLQAAKDERVLGHFYSTFEPPVFFSPHFDVGPAPLRGQESVAFIVDCRSVGDARHVSSNLKRQLQQTFQLIPTTDRMVNIAFYEVKMQNWLFRS